MSPALDAAGAFRLMLRMRLVDTALVEAWADGLVPGEYHSGIGEEAINAGILLHPNRDDALALDHRNTAPLIGRGSDPRSLMLEVLGSETGMNGGMAGHMHLIDPDVRSAADGMVGAAGPLAVGAAFAGRALRQGSVALAFHGEAAMNQGMLMEAHNMAVAWKLPVIFVCKDNAWSITTRSTEVTGGDPVGRARSFGLRTDKAAGHQVASVHAAAGRLIRAARAGKGPGFLHVTSHRPGGHFEGDPLVRFLRDPRSETRTLLPDVLSAMRENTDPSLRGRIHGAAVLGSRVGHAVRDWTLARRKDPVARGRRLLDEKDALRIEQALRDELAPVIDDVRAAVADRPVFGSPRLATPAPRSR